MALACKEGIVFAADSQATHMPIKRIVDDKIKKIADAVLMAGSGSVAQIQKVEDEVEELPPDIRDSNSLKKIKDYIKKDIAHPLRLRTLNHYRRLGYKEKEIGDEAEILICGFDKEKPIIYHLDENAMDLRYTDYHAIGFGRPFAQVILKNYAINELSVDRGKVLAYKVIKEAIETGAYSMDYPINIWTIQKKKGKIIAEKFSQEEIDGIRDTVLALCQVEIDTLHRLSKAEK